MKTRHLASVLTVVGCMTTGIAVPALAAPDQDTTAGIVIAQDRSMSIDATPTAPGQVTVTTEPRSRVSLVVRSRSSEGNRQPMNRMSDGQGRAVFSDLTPGVTYSVLTVDASTSVTALGSPGSVTGLTVTTTDEPGAVRLSWRHRGDRGKVPGVTYRVEAVPQRSAAASIVDETTGASIILRGLERSVRYTFTVTPVNLLGSGTSTSARMNRSLLEITGLDALVEVEEPRESVPAPVTQPVAAPITPNIQPAPAPANSVVAPTPATPPAPRTRTIYVCPDGFSDSGGACSKTSPYTFSTRAYTYTYGKTGTETYVDSCSSGYTDSDGQFHWVEQPHPCQRSRDVYGNIKDPTPAGWSDTGSNWSKKDDAPAGWSDNGSSYVQTADKVAREVPA